MTNETKNVPEIRFPEFDGEWEEKKLGDLASVTKLAGFEFTKHIEYSDFGEIPAIRGLNVKHGGFVFNDVKYIDNSDLSKLSRSKLDGGNIVYTYVGTIGDAAIVPENKLWYLAPNVAKIVTRSIKSKFLLQILLDPNFKKKEVLSWITTSSQPALSMSNIRKFKMNIPKSSIEQEKIGEFFSKLDRQIELEEQKLAKLEEKKKGYMQKIFSQELRFKDENGNEYPEWENKYLKELCLINPKADQLPNTFFYIDLESVNNGKIEKIKEVNKNNAPSRAQRLAKKYDVFYQTVRPYQKNNFINFSNRNDIVVSTGYAQLRPSVQFYYLYSLLLTTSFMNEVLVKCTGTNYPAINSTDLSLIQTLSSSVFEEQEKIGGFFKMIDDVIEKQNLKIEELKKRKQGLLQKMFI